MMRRVGFLVFSGMLAVQQITQVTQSLKTKNLRAKSMAAVLSWMTPTFRRWLASR